MAVELWLCFHVTWAGAWHSFPHVQGQAQSQQQLLLLLLLSLLSSSDSRALLLLGTKQAVFENCCCVILGFFIEFSGLCFCVKSIQSAMPNTQNVTCATLVWPFSALYPSIWQHSHMLGSPTKPQPPWLCNMNDVLRTWLGLYSEKTYPVFLCLMQRLEGVRWTVERKG